MGYFVWENRKTFAVSKLCEIQAEKTFVITGVKAKLLFWLQQPSYRYRKLMGRLWMATKLQLRCQLAMLLKN